jgi:glycosyltransferase domain-containing protein
MHTAPDALPTADDLAALAELSIVVPTYNRPDALARLLAYCAPLPLQLIVVDGSAEPAPLPGLQGQALRLRYFHQPVSIDQRILFALDLCETPFAMFSCDDEYYLARGLVAALARLRAEPALSAVAGRCAAFVCNDQGLQLGTYYNFLKGFGARQPLVSDRLRTAAAQPTLLSGFYYAVCRTGAFRAAARTAFTRRFSCPYVQEILFTLGLFMQGGMQSVPDLVWMRNLQAPPVSNAQWNRKLDFSAWYADPAFADEVAQMRPLIDSLYQRCLAPGEPAWPLDDFFAQLVQFDLLQASGQGESQKAYPFALPAFLLLSRQHGMPVDAASLRRVEQLETAPQLAASAQAQLKARISVW